MISQVRILGINYKINFADLRKQNGNEVAGNVDHQACVINLDNQVNSDIHAGSVLLHEIIEALNYRLELELEHRKITSLEGGLIQVIRDNPELLEVFTQK